MPKMPTRAALARYQAELERDGYVVVVLSASHSVAIHRMTTKPGWRVNTTKNRRLMNVREFPPSATTDQMFGHALTLLNDQRRA